MTDDLEQPLTGGAQTSGLVRVGDTVRRPSHPRSGFVQRLLRHLEDVGFAGAPRALGFDGRGREILTYVEGTVPAAAPYRLSDAQLISAAGLVRDFHDATVSFDELDGGEVICHSDLGPHNTVFRGDRAVAIIDWDADLGPGRRAVDFAQAVWGFADLTEESVPLDEQARKTAVLCAEYPTMTPKVVVDELAARFLRARDAHAAAGRVGAVQVFEGLLAWIDAHGAAIAPSTV